MYNQPTNDAMMTRVPFILPAQIEGDFSAEELSEDMDGVTLRFPRAKIPGGGTLQFELTGENPDEPEYAKSIEGVLMFTHLAIATRTAAEREQAFAAGFRTAMTMMVCGLSAPKPNKDGGK